MPAAHLIRLNRSFSQNGLYRNGLQYFRLTDEKAASLPNRSEKIISGMAILVGICGVGFSMFCTRQLSEEPSLSTTCTLVSTAKKK